jgi:hypothetical protein
MKELELTQGQVTKVDDSDFEWLNRWNWYARWDSKLQSFLAVRHEYQGRGQVTIYMHRLVLGVSSSEEVDHENHDTLDNQRHNLRRCKHSQNMGNKRRYKNNKSGYKGVSWHDGARRWRARIKFLGHEYHLGLFGSIEAAARAYDKAALEMLGEFSLLNSPVKEE